MSFSGEVRYGAGTQVRCGKCRRGAMRLSVSCAGNRLRCQGRMPQRPVTMSAMIRVRTVALLLAALLSGCTRAEPARQYQLKGQILGIDTDGHKLVVAHEDIPGFMPAMTM